MLSIWPVWGAGGNISTTTDNKNELVVLAGMRRSKLLRAELELHKEDKNNRQYYFLPFINTLSTNVEFYLSLKYQLILPRDDFAKLFYFQIFYSLLKGKT